MSDIVVVESTSLIEDIIAIEKEEVSTVVVEASDTPTVVVVGNALNTNIVNEITTSTSTNIVGILKGASGNIAQATAGTDYLTPTGSAAQLTNFPTLNQDTTGSAVYWKTSGTGKAGLTGPAVGTIRTYTFPDADATVLTSTTAGVQTFLTTPSSANLASMITDETGSGALVFGTSPTFTTSITCPLIKPLVDSTTAVQITKADGTTPIITVDTASSPTMVDILNTNTTCTRYGSAPIFAYRQARGTVSSPSAIDAAGRILMNIQGRGYDGTTSWDSTSAGGITLVSEEAFSSTAHGTRMIFLTVPIGGTTATERMRIDNAGNVGIGATTLTEKLHVNGNVLLTGQTTHQLTLTGSATSGRFGQDATGIFFISDTNGAAVRFLVNNGAALEGMRIISSGNVGINTTDPSSKLDVLGTARFGDHTTNYSLFDTDGTLTFVGTSHIPFGSFYGDNITETVTVSVTDTYYEVGGGISGGTCSGFTFQNNKELKCLVAGKYKVDYSISLYTAAANQEIETEVMINTTAQSNTSNHTQSITANKPVSLSGTGIITLAVNDVVKVAVSNHTATNNIVIEHINLTLVMVGG